MISLHLATEGEAFFEASTNKVNEVKRSERDTLKKIAWINQNLERPCCCIDMIVPSSEPSSRFSLSSSLDDVDFLVKYVKSML
jgi:mannitol-1-phosphate/altronate dehydrogenase